ncbi:hypothetical protein DB891_02505 [Flavobacterium laiguense]|uniref:Uncharacterized protein n=2 Tax=Flavobacterium laiguense TaxID=2169409 RepID=A0A2U1K3E0_9FLAO|nr:hypothetical protein DB891_02505 [Flavobacterium laiguense]
MMLYWIGYHKNFDKKNIPQNADGIVMVDIKNIRNYFIFSYLKNPSQWQLGTTEINKKFDFSNFGIETPDYLAFFHLENQPVTQWFTVVKIESETDFEKTIAKAHFSKIMLKNGMSSYYSKQLGICIIKHSNQIICSAIPENQKKIALKIAEDLFLKHQFLDPKKTEKTISTSNAVTVWIKKNNLLKEDGILNLKLGDQEVTVDGQLQFKSKYKKEWQFTQNPNALFALGVNFEMIQDQIPYKQNPKRINRIIGFDLDSILIHNPTKTELVLNEIVEKKDSAISYEYDDNFNSIKKVIVHTSREPSFNFSMQTEDSKRVYDYLKSQNAIDKHQVFVNFPLAVTKIFVKNNTLTLETNPKKQASLKSSLPKTGYLKVNFNKLHAKDWRFMIAKNENFGLLKPFGVLEITLTQDNNLSHFQALLKTKDGKSLIVIMK